MHKNLSRNCVDPRNFKKAAAGKKRFLLKNDFSKKNCLRVGQIFHLPRVILDDFGAYSEVELAVLPGSDLEYRPGNCSTDVFWLACEV